MRERATNMLVEGFFVPVLEEVAVDELREDMDELIVERLTEYAPPFSARRGDVRPRSQPAKTRPSFKYHGGVIHARACVHCTSSRSWPRPPSRCTRVTPIW
ncbi:hypothetical protein [Halosimplex pelagicum]|uniref:Uncharacterized protein n=1 Tax=Halosimplex pelagicum TaxID=869886 RepID=A0A7D5PCN6_9EURY|nr:hypothetical protein [Halosimplex pelagicum]QLH80100.1 hypothetical protein HZS54_23670 [Halosimplex pelagicum]